MINLARLHEYPLVSVDVETSGVYWYRGDKMFGVAVGVWDGEHIYSDYWDIREQPNIKKILDKELPKCRRIVNHNIKFDAHFLLDVGINVPLDRLECTMVRAALINEHEKSFTLDSLCHKYINKGKIDIYDELAKMFGGPPTRDAQIKNLHRAPFSLARKYAAPDPALAIELWLWQEGEIKRQDLHRVWDLERRILPILVHLERRGVRVDEDRAQKSLADVKNEIANAKVALHKIAGKEINANSPKQVKEFLGVRKHEADNPKGYEWTTDTGFRLPFTETGEASIGKDELIIMVEQGDKRAEAILTLRKMVKAQSFLKDHILGHAVNGRVHPNYNQTRNDRELGTGTGRFSMDDPALQQIPSRDVDVARLTRSCFIPEDRHDWCCADWEQFEFRWFAHYTQDPAILKAYEDDPETDYHQIVSDLTGIPRKPRFAGDANAKQINLGLVFGMGKGKMAYEMGLDYEVRYGDDDREWFIAGPKADAIFNTYHKSIPGVSALLSQASSIARSRGFVQTIMGRHLRFPGGKATHKAGGLVFQGSSADCMKQKMIELWPIAEKEGFQMLLTVHDELDWSLPKKMSKHFQSIIKKNLETFDGVECPIKCRIPILSDVAVGPNWFEASK